MKRVNRRQLTHALFSGAAAAAAVPGLGAQAPAAQSADELLAAAKRQIVNNRETLNRMPLPMATEPASAFRAS